MFQNGQYGQENLSGVLYAHRLDGDEHVKLEVWSAPGLTKPSFEEAKRQTYKPAKKGDKFGPSWTNHWFRVTIKIPKEFEEYERVQLEFDLNGEAMVFTTDGDPIHGTSCQFLIRRHALMNRSDRRLGPTPPRRVHHPPACPSRRRGALLHRGVVQRHVRPVG